MAMAARGRRLGEDLWEDEQGRELRRQLNGVWYDGTPRKGCGVGVLRWSGRRERRRRLASVRGKAPDGDARNSVAGLGGRMAMVLRLAAEAEGLRRKLAGSRRHQLNQACVRGPERKLLLLVEPDARRC